jgi:hypothetical protein
MPGQAASEARSDCCMMPGRETSAVGMGEWGWIVDSLIWLGTLLSDRGDATSTRMTWIGQIDYRNRPSTHWISHTTAP